MHKGSALVSNLSTPEDFESCDQQRKEVGTENRSTEKQENQPTA